ncbi:MAG TPA: hypothetical protein VF596_22765 [Pyrinomonadaceae bacterium]|jgi:NO-binding membrane sensor protein with MHYT domain
MLKTIYLILALAATGTMIWQMGFLFSIPGAPVRPDYTITLSALTAAVIFFGLWYASVVNREKTPERILS